MKLLNNGLKVLISSILKISQYTVTNSIHILKTKLHLQKYSRKKSDKSYIPSYQYLYNRLSLHTSRVHPLTEIITNKDKSLLT